MLLGCKTDFLRGVLILIITKLNYLGKMSVLIKFYDVNQYRSCIVYIILFMSCTLHSYVWGSLFTCWNGLPGETEKE